MTKRSSNVDLFRIIATLLVVLLHVLGYGGILTDTSPHEVKHWAARFFEALSYCAVDCFALISGYLMVNKNIKLRSIINLWFQVFFYSVLFAAVFYIFKPETRSIEDLAFSVFPVMRRTWWYVSAYFALFFVIPFLNKAVENISRQTYKKFLLLVLAAVCVLECVTRRDPFFIGLGYSPIWLIIVYLFGAYIRKYNLAQKISAGKSRLGFFAAITATFISEIVLYFLTERVLGQPKGYDMLLSYTSITVFLSAVFLFLFCLNVKINSLTSKIIGIFSPAALGVYLIHVHPYVFNNILSGSCAELANKPLVIMLVGVFLVTLGVFVACSIVDLLRIQLFKLIKVKVWSEKIENKLSSMYLRIFEK